MDYEKLCKGSPKIFKSKVGETEGEKLKKALDFLGMDATPEETRTLATAILVIGTCASVILIFFVSLLLGFSILWLLFAAFPVVLYLYLRRYPVFKSESEKRNAINRMPEVASYLIMSLRVSPNPEKAVEFAAAHSAGLFKKRFEEMMSGIKSGRGTADSGLAKLGEEFGEKSEEFKRAMRLIIASIMERTEGRRQETLDKASEVLLGGLAARTEREARALNTPVMIVFTFGVILPLVFVAIIPFMSLMGIQIGAITIAILYTIGLPLFLFVLIKFIASNRPVTMVPPDVPQEKKIGPALLIGIAVGVLLSSMALLGNALGAMKYLPLLWGIGAGAGIFFFMTTRKARKARKVIKSLESGFGETLHTLGVSLSEGKPLESAMSDSGKGFLGEAAKNIRALNTDLKAAFFDEKFGSMRDIRSGTIRGVMEILISLANKGSDVMAKVSFRMSEHLANLRKSEIEIERALGSVVSSMKIIAMVVAPLVGGMISSMSVVLAETMTKTQGASMAMNGAMAEPLDPSLVTAIIGVYVMESAAILVMFGTDLMNGDDKVMKKYGIGLALPVSIFVFTACELVANMLFGGIA